MRTSEPALSQTWWGGGQLPADGGALGGADGLTVERRFLSFFLCLLFFKWNKLSCLILRIACSVGKGTFRIEDKDG